ncbi:MAG: FAD-binding protein [Bacteriovoracaceae bacterium]|nr:FAD-binding protein [Bacteriovoracaceae bacterium]
MKIYDDLVTRNLYSTDASMFRVLPQYVVEPENIDDVRAALKMAREKKIHVACRGGGTGLAGESLSEGMVIDFSVHFDRILKLVPEKQTVIVEAGVIHGVLNKKLAEYGLLFGPDPATSNRCTMGGMLANNSTGAHSLRYGMTMDWVVGLKVMLSDGEVVQLRRDHRDQISREDFKKVIRLLKANEELIDIKWPKTPRNRHGYLLRDIVHRDGTVDLFKLFVGSEGTLGVILEAELKVAKLPTYSKLICLSFATRKDAATATATLLKYDPGAVEIVDSICLDLARSSETYLSIFPREVDSILMVELDGENLDDITRKTREITEEYVGEGKLATGIIIPRDDEEKKTIWQMRKLIAGMINKVPGKFQPVPVIEDVCIRPELLPLYFEAVDDILKKRGLKFLCFGHAGDGTVHIRPFLDLKNETTYQWLPSVCDEIYKVTLEMEGTISGEHGDGYLRAPFIEKQYGELFPVFVELKKILDPYNILNPDKQTGCTDFGRWQNNHKYRKGDTYRPILNWKEGALLDNCEACNGCGECRTAIKERDMCPMFRAFGLEVSTTRAKANLMRSFLYGDLKGVSKKELKRVASYCINCKRCEHDCPSGVRGGDLMAEIKALAGPDFYETILCNMEKGMRVATYFPRTSNFLSSLAISRFFMEKFFGLDARRTPPKFAVKSFRKQKKKYKESRGKSEYKVALFMDSFVELMEGQVAEAFVAILHHNDIEVVVPNQKGSAIVNMNYGDIKTVSKNARLNSRYLGPYVDNGYTIVCPEPSAALMLKDEYAMVAEGNYQQKVAKSTMDAMSFLYKLHREGKLKTDFTAMKVKVGYHAPCHLKMIGKSEHALEVMDLIPELRVELIDQGCCGIAGTFGMKKSSMDTSLKIAEGLFSKLSNDSIEIGATECSTCNAQMAYGSGKKILHPLVIIAKSYGLL